MLQLPCCSINRSFGWHHPGAHGLSTHPQEPALLGTQQGRSLLQAHGRSRPRAVQPASALRIDRAARLERLWQSQAAEEVRLAEEELAARAGRHVLELRDLAHLDRILEESGSSVVAVAFYSRSCGSCREVMQRYTELCLKESHARAGLRFIKHNIRNDFDDPSDVARMFRVRAAPTFYFFVGGANVQQLQMRDMRSLTGSSAHIQRLLTADHRRLSAALREVLFRTAPSARR